MTDAQLFEEIKQHVLAREYIGRLGDELDASNWQHLTTALLISISHRDVAVVTVVDRNDWSQTIEYRGIEDDTGLAHIALEYLGIPTADVLVFDVKFGIAEMAPRITLTVCRDNQQADKTETEEDQ